MPCRRRLIGLAGGLTRTKDWHNLLPSGSVRSWPRDGRAGSPFWGGRKASLRELQEDQDSAGMIKIDIAHTYAIAGYGKDELASTLVFLAVRCKLFGQGVFERQLEEAFGAFKEWCVANGKTTSICEFSKSELKITSLLAFSL